MVLTVPSVSVPSPVLVTVLPAPARPRFRVRAVPPGVSNVAPPLPMKNGWSVMIVRATPNVAPAESVMRLAAVPSAP